MYRKIYNNTMYEVSIQHYGESYEKKTRSLNQAKQWAEDAVYEIGAENAIIYNPDDRD